MSSLNLKSTDNNKKAGPDPAFNDSLNRDLQRSINQLWINLSHITSFAALDDLHSFFGAKETIHGAGTRLFEIFVVLPVVSGFFLPLLTKIFEALDVINTFVIGQNGDHFVINLATIIKGHDPDDSCFHDRTRN